ncbi:MAG: hypothetical protein H7Z76_04945 [Methylotenera sp.]|nr:hypothetical protein [Flavobacterium sp.]
MDQFHHDVLRKIRLFQSIIQDYRDDLKHLRIYNSFETYYGKNYLRIYFELEIKDDSSKRWEFSERYTKDIHYYTNENYISFHLPERNRDLTDQELRNKPQELHYEWITNLFEWLNYNHQDSPKLIIEDFVSQLDLKREEEKASEVYEIKNTQLFDSFKDIKIQENQLLVINEYHNSFRIGRVLKSDSVYFKLAEVKKDLTNGKKEIHYVNMDKIYAIIEPKELDAKITKEIILDHVQNYIHFNGLKYIRPKELW